MTWIFFTQFVHHCSINSFCPNTAARYHAENFQHDHTSIGTTLEIQASGTLSHTWLKKMRKYGYRDAAVSA